MSQAGISIPTPTVTYTPPPDPTLFNYADGEARRIEREKEQMSLYRKVINFFRDRAKKGDW